MADWLPTLLATIAGILSTSSFVPQVMKAVREGDTGAISKKMYFVTVTAFTLWTVYGFLLGSWVLIVFNLASLALSSFILFLKLRQDRAEGAAKAAPQAAK